MTSSSIQEAREALRGVAGELQEILLRLTQLREGLPASPSEESLKDLEPRTDAPTEMRAVIGCVQRDYLGPAMRDLLTAAAFRSTSAPLAKGGLIPPGLDLAVESEATRQALYALITKDNFGPADSAEPERWRPPYGPQEAGLEVYFHRGRWFTTWLKLEEPESLPEAERRELLVLAEDPEEPGRLIYRGV